MLTRGVTIAGRFEVIRPLARGGMAEVYLARQVGQASFERLVAVKTIRSRHADDPVFQRMFFDEIRVASDLRHPNVVSLIDAGVDGEVTWLAMEYLAGRPLADVLDLVRKTERLPLAFTLEVIVGAARGLHYAHQKRDLSGQPLHIVHRDISPQNLFVTYDGVTKVLDFGIAKALHRAEQTEVGVVKGKVAYMSPEQTAADPLDARSDQFSLGICLWEFLARRRLFEGETARQTMAQVVFAEIPPPSAFSDEVPPVLDEIVLRALNRDRDERFSSCAAFADALFAHAHAEGLLSGPLPVVQVLKRLFPPGDESFLAPHVRAAGPGEPTGPGRPVVDSAVATVGALSPAGAARLGVEDAEDAPTVPLRSALPIGEPAAPASTSATTSLSPPPTSSPPAPTETATAPLVSPRRALPPIFGGVAVVTVTLAWALQEPASSASPPATPLPAQAPAPGPPRALSAPSMSSAREPVLPPKPLPRSAAVPRPPSRHSASAAAPPPAAPPASVAPAVVASGVLSFPDANPWYRVAVDGRVVGITPLARVPAVAGTHVVEFFSSDTGVVIRRVEIDVGDGETVRVRAQAAP
jgi:serine/threonine-protein kinase